MVASTQTSLSSELEDDEDGPHKNTATTNDDEDDEDKETIEARFLTIVQSMELSNLETAALRFAIARESESVRNCLETYKLTRNDDMLKKSLKSIAESTIN